MKIKLLFYLAAFLCSWAASASTNITFWAIGTNINLQVSQTFVIPTNQICKILSTTGTSLSVGYSNRIVLVSSNELIGAKPLTLVGPATLQIGAGPLSLSFCTLELSSNEEISQTPSGTVVIPADSSGPVNIILESSVDLVTWTAALPGTYGTSTEKRFFRVRAERAP